MSQNQLREMALCFLCSRDLALQSSLRASIDDSRNWFRAHPVIAGDFPVANNIKQALWEGCDFAATVLDCVTRRRVAPAYANFRCLMERMHYAFYFVRAEGAEWEYDSMARRQKALDRKLGQGPPEDREWVKQYLEGIRHWNRHPDDDKPRSMRKHTTYSLDVGEMAPVLREWYDAFSMHVHPTYKGEGDVGRELMDNEVNFLVPQSHLMLCAISWVARTIDEAVSDHPHRASIDKDQP